MSEFLRVYHVTPETNAESIGRSGVLPAFSRGARRCSYWVTDLRIIWALAHVSRKWNVPVSGLVVFSAKIGKKGLKVTGIASVFCCDEKVHPDEYTSAAYYLDE